MAIRRSASPGEIKGFMASDELQDFLNLPTGYLGIGDDC